MKKKIQEYITDLEQRENVKVLLACETGSRAWGFPSPDSDYDVRLLYLHPKDWYLSLTEPTDSIDLMLDDNLVDISGWDFRKALRLLQRSNAALLERLQSPLVYQKDAPFVRTMLELAQSQYSRIATIHHYMGIADKFLEAHLPQEPYKFKQFFYGLRSAMACKWILEKEQMPPIVFKKMYTQLDLPQPLIEHIEKLIKLKARVNESYLHDGEQELFDYMKSWLAEAQEKKQNLPPASGSFLELDQFYRKVVNRQ